jgi:hypothetical protein
VPEIEEPDLRNVVAMLRALVQLMREATSDDAANDSYIREISSLANRLELSLAPSTSPQWTAVAIQEHLAGLAAQLGLR